MEAFILPGWFEGYRCHGCHVTWWTSTPVYRETGPLTDFEKLTLAHLGCGAFGHSACLPWIWLDTLQIGSDAAIRSELLGSLPHLLLPTRSSDAPARPAAVPKT